jgi:L-ascorbate metabolism protein UlaG (beta-lactamase superfamily)
MRWLILLSFLGVGWLTGASAVQRGGECAITYVANAGVLFETDEQKFLFDAPIREGIPPYATATAEQRRSLETAAAPFDNVTAILITHWHEDHLSAEAVASHLRNSPSTRLVSSEEVVQRVRTVTGPAVPAAQFGAVTPAPGTSERAAGSGVPVHVLRIRHNPARRLPEQHVGFVVEGCRTVLHTGDADPVADNFSLLRSLPQIDTALLPFWYVMSDSNRRFVASSIGPRRILGIHLPPTEVAEMTKRLSTMPNITLLTAPGMRVPLR